MGKRRSEYALGFAARRAEAKQKEAVSVLYDSVLAVLLVKMHQYCLGRRSREAYLTAVRE